MKIVSYCPSIDLIILFKPRRRGRRSSRELIVEKKFARNHPGSDGSVPDSLEAVSKKLKAKRNVCSTFLSSNSLSFWGGGGNLVESMHSSCS